MWNHFCCRKVCNHEVSAAALKFVENGPSGFLEFYYNLDPEENREEERVLEAVRRYRKLCVGALRNDSPLQAPESLLRAFEGGRSPN